MKVQSISVLSANNNINIQKSKVNSYSNNFSNSIQNSAINFQHKNVLNNTTKNSIRALVLALGMLVAPQVYAQQANNSQPQAQEIVYNNKKSFNKDSEINKLEGKKLAHEVVDMEINTVKLKQSAIASLPDSINQAIAIMNNDVKLADSTGAVLDNLIKAVKDPKNAKSIRDKAFRDIQNSQLDSIQKADLVKKLEDLRSLSFAEVAGFSLPDNINNPINSEEDVLSRKIAIDTLVARIDNRNKFISSEIVKNNNRVNTNNTTIGDNFKRKKETENNEKMMADNNITIEGYNSPLESLKDKIQTAQNDNVEALVEIAKNTLILENLKILLDNIKTEQKSVNTVYNDIVNMNEFLEEAEKRENKLVVSEEKQLNKLINRSSTDVKRSGVKGNRLADKSKDHTAEAKDKGTVANYTEKQYKSRNQKSEAQNDVANKSLEKRIEMQNIVNLYNEKKADLEELKGNQ